MVVFRSNVRRKISQGRYRRVARLYHARSYGSNSGAATTPASRTLGRITSSYRYANPMLIQPSNARTMSFWRSCTFSLVLQQGPGFLPTAGVASPCLAFAFDLNGAKFWCGGIYYGTIPISGSTEFQALFDTYKINAVKMKMFFAHNFSNVNTPATCLPIMHVVNDFDDSTEILSVATVQEKSGVRIVQFDANNGNGFNHYVKPSCRQVVSQINETTGAESVSSAGTAFGAQWLDCANNNIIHSGMKIVYNNQGRTSTTDIGNVTFYFDMQLCFKGVR